MYQIFTVKNVLEKAWEFNVDIQHISIYFQSACDSIEKDKVYDIIKFLVIPNILIRLIKAMNDSAYHVKIGLMMTDGFTVGNSLK